jgi:hypothetical protein
VIFVYRHFSGRVTGAGSEEGGYGGA